MIEKTGAKHLGLDIGTKNARGAVVNKQGQVLHVASVPIASDRVGATRELLDQLQSVFPFNEIATAAVTGRGQDMYKGQPGWLRFTSPYSDLVGLIEDKAGIIVAIGAQSSQVIEPGKEGRPWRSTQSPLCAAGTGQFLEQQARRMGIGIEQFGSEALKWPDKAPRIASRCSVFAKSDLIHLQQKGWPIEAMLTGLSESVARMIEAQWRGEFAEPIYLIGGVAANQGVAKALERVLQKPVFVPDNYDQRGAIGAARLSREANFSPKDFYPQNDGDSHLFYVENPLKRTSTSTAWKPKELEPGVIDVYLGIDVGSTSTKIVLIDSNGEVVAKKYVMTAGQPLKAIQSIMSDPEIAKLENQVNIKAVGVTGSGRYLVGDAVGADLVKNEITAQTRAAVHIDPSVETVFELGGQDSKYAYLQNRVVLDYQMNKACAAGTGSFIDELAELIGVSTKTGEFAKLAFGAKQLPLLGEKCTAFMGQAVGEAQQAGATKGEITAGLATSLVENYKSKVVGGRRIGKNIFLTGAVFYNEAVVAAFKAAFPGHEFTVPEHKEVTGAIGAALLAKEAQVKKKSGFKGFSGVASETYQLTYSNCNLCEQACAISTMMGKDGRKTHYGSRCDRLDAKEVSGREYKKPATPFNIREELLFEGYNPELGDENMMVGIPQALMTYDLAPMLIGFLNTLGVRIRFTSLTNNKIVGESTKHAYTDSCFPVKLLHGHTQELLEAGVNHVLIPNAIRMSEMGNEADQRYSCPLVQSAPYIIKSVFDLGEKLLDPVIDFSRGDEAVIKSFTEVAMRLGFDKEQGKEAAQAGLAKQREFESKLQEIGKKLLDELADDPNAIGIVLLSRAYNAQDSGANLGMADELYKQGIIPLPLDYLPLNSVDVGDITDRPYWNYERKILQAAKIIAGNPQLFGLFLTNFGCGPNSFIEGMVGDIMGDKPWGQLEVDEHAAEAGYITRLEALVDTVRGYLATGKTPDINFKKHTRQAPAGTSAGTNVVIPRMSDHVEVLAGAMRHFGVNAAALPDSREESLALVRDVTSGKECLPFRDSTGEALWAYQQGMLPASARFLMAGAYGPCRLGKYSQEQQRIFDELGIPLITLTTVSDNNYADLGLSYKFDLLAWKGIVATDRLQQMLWRTRPYEKYAGQADRLYQETLGKLVRAIEANDGLEQVMREAREYFKELCDPYLPNRPLVGINGEIYLRANSFCNKDLVILCEENGLEVEVAPMGEWVDYVTTRRQEDAWADFGRVGFDPRKIKELKETVIKLARAYLRSGFLSHYDRQITSWANGHHKEPSPTELIKASSDYLPSRNGSEAVLSIGGGVLQMMDRRYAGVISVMPHGCMPGGIVAAFSEQISKQYGNKPWISLTYDGSPEDVNRAAVASFAERIVMKNQVL